MLDSGSYDLKITPTFTSLIAFSFDDHPANGGKTG
jgi:hypothetical protein